MGSDRDWSGGSMDVKEGGWMMGRWWMVAGEYEGEDEGEDDGENEGRMKGRMREMK